MISDYLPPRSNVRAVAVYRKGAMTIADMLMRMRRQKGGGRCRVSSQPRPPVLSRPVLRILIEAKRRGAEDAEIDAE